MTVQLRIILGVLVICYFIVIMRFVNKKILLLKYALLWIFTGIALGLLVLFPRLLDYFVAITGVQLASNGLFLLGIGFTVILVMSLTAIVSRQSERIKSLAQANAVMEKRIRDLERRL
jgi:hypothetical protein